MGRIFETRKATMFARWNKMSKAFTRAAKDITMAAKSGSDASTNPGLRRAIHNARALNMPKDKIDGAIKRATSKDTADYQEVIYEGYAPHGVAVMVVAATDNPTRTVANVRTAFKKAGGSMGASGSVAFGFNRVGVFRLAPEGLDLEALELELIDHGLEEMGEGTGEKGEPVIVVRCALHSFGDMQHALEERKITPISSALEFIPSTPVTLPEDQAAEVLKMVDTLEQDEDVQDVFHNLGMILVPLIGGLLIGAAALGLQAAIGRIAGISGIAAGLLETAAPAERTWRIVFLAGLLSAGVLFGLVYPAGFTAVHATAPGLLVAAGLLVGFGTQLGNGCTSGHGICGVGRLSPRSLVATGVFIAVAMITVLVARQVS